LVGLGAVVWGTKITLDNAVVIARHYQVSDFFIGVAVLAIGSDLPELVVSIDAALRQLADQDTSNLIVGNAIGSCFGQLGLVLGIAGMLGPLSPSRRQIVRHGGVLIVATGLLMLVGFDGVVQRLEGFGLILAFGAYIVFLLNEEGLVSRSREPGRAGVAVIWVRLALGLAVVVVSAEVIVRTAVTLAEQWGVDQSFLGITIIGVGTSLPELVISVAAMLRARIGFSIGNLIGSNILDTLLPIGIAAAIVPIEFARSLLEFDMLVLLAMTLVALGFLYRSRGVRRPQAIIVLGIYLGYLTSKTLAL
ncbi:MAG: sodium:calcium antiporter, partial [Pseudomonadales bacterium]